MLLAGKSVYTNQRTCLSAWKAGKCVKVVKIAKVRRPKIREVFFQFNEVYEMSADNFLRAVSVKYNIQLF